MASGVALLGFYIPLSSRAAQCDGAANRFAPNACIRVYPGNSVAVVVGASETGQGVLTSVRQIVSDEMDADWRMVSFEPSPVHPDYDRPG